MRNLAYLYSSQNQSSDQTGVVPATMTKTIPFDYVFDFKLKGERDNIVQDVVEISMQGVFVAVSIGYSVVPNELDTTRTLPPVIDQRTFPQSPIFVPFFSEGSPVDDNLVGMLVAGMPDAEITILNLPDTDPPSNILRTVVKSIDPDGTVTAEFLDQTPSDKTDLIRLGGDGTVKVIFDPISSRSFLRVWDRTNNTLSQLFAFGAPPIISPPIIFFSSGGGGAPPSTPLIGPGGTTRKAPAAGETDIFVYGSPESEVNLFLLGGSTGNTTKVNVPGPLRLKGDTTFGRRTGTAKAKLLNPLSPGDVLLVQDATAGQISPPFSMFAVPLSRRLSTITLGEMAASTDLTCGIRLNRNSTSLFLADPPLDNLSAGRIDRVFERCCSDEVSFLYSIDIVSTGRELQNEAIHNIAGLGIANGDRPFRPFARPMAFPPRSFIRIQIKEISGPPGALQIVLQGYKILGTGRIPE